MIGSARIGIYTNANNWSDQQPRDRAGVAVLSVALRSLFAFGYFFSQERRDGRCQGVRILPRLVSISTESRESQWAVGRVAGLGPLLFFSLG
jgi:hypothetical protein